MTLLINGVPVYDGCVYLKDWMAYNGYRSKDELICTHEDPEVYEPIWDEMIDEFQEWCDDNEVVGDY